MGKKKELNPNISKDNFDNIENFMPGLIESIPKPEFVTKKGLNLEQKRHKKGGGRKSELDKEVSKRYIKYYRSIGRTYEEISGLTGLSKPTICAYMKELEEEKLKTVDKSVKKMQIESVERLDGYIIKLYDFLEDCQTPQQIATLMNMIYKSEELRAKIGGYLINKIEEKSNKLDEFLNKI